MCSLHREIAHVLSNFVGKQEGKKSLAKVSVNTRVE